MTSTTYHYDHNYLPPPLFSKLLLVFVLLSEMMCSAFISNNRRPNLPPSFPVCLSLSLSLSLSPSPSPSHFSLCHFLASAIFWSQCGTRWIRTPNHQILSPNRTNWATNTGCEGWSSLSWKKTPKTASNSPRREPKCHFWALICLSQFLLHSHCF